MTEQQRGCTLCLRLSVVFRFRVSVDAQGYPHFQYRVVATHTTITGEMFCRNAAPHSYARIYVAKFERQGTSSSQRNWGVAHVRDPDPLPIKKHQTLPPSLALL